MQGRRQGRAGGRAGPRARAAHPLAHERLGGGPVEQVAAGFGAVRRHTKRQAPQHRLRERQRQPELLLADGLLRRSCKAGQLPQRAHGCRSRGLVSRRQHVLAGLHLALHVREALAQLLGRQTRVRHLQLLQLLLGRPLVGAGRSDQQPDHASVTAQRDGRVATALQRTHHARAGGPGELRPARAAGLQQELLQRVARGVVAPRQRRRLLRAAAVG
jgi:hypothetical protein